MHELSLGSAVVETVERHAAGRRVSVVTLRVGHLRQVVAPSLEFYFGMIGRGTVCEEARLEIVEVPARLRCAACDREWGIDLPDFRCPTCAGVADVIGGKEFEVESIDVEATCTAPM